MLRRILLSCFLALVTASTVLPQSYQTSFSDIKFDRAKGPATFSGGVEVDAATGAASMNIPFGPGIGERGLKFRPVLSMRMAPQLGISSVDENRLVQVLSSGGQIWAPDTVDTLYQRGFGTVSFTPGSLNLGNLVSPVYPRKTSYQLPGGGGGRILGLLPSGVTTTAVEGMLAKFGYTNNDAVGYLPGDSTRTTKERFIQISSAGHLVVGLRQAGPEAGTTDEILADIQEMPSSTYRWDLPRRILVIQGDVAYEFLYSGHSYITNVIPYLAISQKRQLDSGHYVIHRILNRFGESIEFTHDADGRGYTALWKVNQAATSGPSIRVALLAGSSTPPANQPWLTDSRFNLSSVSQIRVTYLGISQPVSSYLLEVADPKTGGPIPTLANGDENAPEGLVQPVRVVQEATNEEIKFGYGTADPTAWGAVTITPTVLSSVSFSTRTVNLAWQAYPFRMNYNAEAWGGMTSSSAPCRPAYAYGVVGVDDSDGTQTRGYRHHRVTPTSNWGYYELGTAPPDQWVSTTFYDAINHPDGSTSVHRFVEPTTSGSGMQDLAFIKTVEREVRYYAPGVDWTSDLAVTNPASSSAYKWVVKDRFDVRTVGAPNGETSYQSVPYPTRIRTWDKESQVLSIEESTDWDSASFGWKTLHRTTSIDASPVFTMDYLSLAQQGSTYTEYPATKGTYRRTDKTYDTKATDWFIARVKTDQTTTVKDLTGFLAPTATVPDAQPLIEKTYHSSINRVESVGVKGADGLTVTTNLNYQGASGLAATELLSAFLTSPGLPLSGQLGVSAYGYDANGYLNSISQKPNAATTLTTGQSQDELGRPTSQVDMNGKVQSFGWDGAGRLTRITPPDGDWATDITYEPDFRGIVLTRGQQVTKFRFNGFGQLILERRLAPDGTWSHRIYGYDLAGRKTGETVWLAGDGANQEADWAKDYLVQTTTVTTTTPDVTTCKTWGLDGTGNPVCLEWVTTPGTSTTTTYNPLYKGALTKYDGRGRVVTTMNANNIMTQIDYFGNTTLPPGAPGYVGPVRRVTVGAGTPDAQTTWYESDAMGRLVRVTDALNQLTEYRYDGGDRIAEVRQYNAAGAAQTRTWSYNRLGWLNGLSQPESGATSYGGFTVAGKPTITSYMGRVVRMTPDWMGRPTIIKSDDLSVDQEFTYDTSVGGAGRVATSRDGIVSTSFAYGAPGARLDNLLTMVRGQPFTQTFSYDAYGNRTSGNTSHATWAQSFSPVTGLPNQLTYGGNLVADTPWNNYDPVSWAVRTIRYGNNAVSSFDYDADQSRLHQVVHNASSGGPVAQWVYEYNQVGNLTREFDLLTGSFDKYEYDGLNRLVSALVQSSTFGDQLQSFTYDAFGNRTSSAIMAVTGWSGTRGAEGSIPATTTSPLVSVSDRKITNAAFDANVLPLKQKNQMPDKTAAGALTGAIYDDQGNLTQIFEKPGDAATAVNMAYDALGRVTSLGRSGGISERYLYTAEGLRSLVEEWQGSTLLKRKYNIYNDSRQVVSQYEEVLSGGTISSGTMQSLVAGASKTSKSKTSSSMVAASIGTNPVISSPSGPITVRVNEAILFTGSSPDGNGGTWAFGDGGSATGWSTSHAYATAGTYTATLSTQVPVDGKCLRWGWDADGNRVCTQFQTTWVTQSTSVTITVLPNAPSIPSFTASPTTVPVGSSSTLSWNVTGADSVTLSGAAVSSSGGQVVYPSSTTTYTLTATNSGGTSSATVTVYVVQAPVISGFGASPSSIYQGDGSTLSWSVSGATSLSLDQGIGNVLGSTSRAVSPSGSTLYTLTAVNSMNGVDVVRTATATVTVSPRPTVPTIVQFAPDAATIGAGNGTTLRWNVTNAVGNVNVSLSSVGPVAATGSIWVTPGITTAYTLTATNTLDSSKSVSAYVTITVIQKPVITFDANTTNVNIGNSATLTWSITNSPTSVVLDNGIGSVGATGPLVVTPSVTTTYTITASNLGGSASKQVTISVTQKPVITSFLAEPASITKGRSSTLSWATQGATSITLNGQSMTGNSIVVAPSSSQTYTLVATNAAGSVSSQVTVTVTESGTLTWKRDILYLGTREAAEFDAAGMHVTQVDHLGSPRIVTGPTGQVESRQKYLPFGELLDQSGSYTTSKGYTGHEQTDASGLIYMQARFYIPWFGRFTSPDPARDQHFEETQSWNIYSYVRNSPILHTDPTGMLDSGTTGDDGGKPGPVEPAGAPKPRTIAERLDSGGNGGESVTKDVQKKLQDAQTEKLKVNYASLDFDPKGSGQNLTAVKNFDIAFKANTLAEEALNVASELYSEGLHNGEGDAFRHAFWSFNMTQEFGEKGAKEIGDAHERLPVGRGEGQQPAGEQLMDLRNNRAGRELALLNPWVKDRSEVTQIIQDAMKKGVLTLRPVEGVENAKP